MLLPVFFAYRPSHRINLIAKSKRSFSRSGFGGALSILGLITATILFCVMTSTLKGADVTPLDDLDTQATSDVSSAIVRKPKQIVTALSFRQIQAPISSQMLREKSDAPQSSIKKYAASAGLGINRYWQMDFTLNATKSEITTNEESSDKNNGNKFAGATIASKFGLLQMNSIGIALIPFIETPSQSGADDDFARSGKTKGGWATMLSYVASGILQVNMEGGFRYREREEFAKISLRNEMFYRSSLEAFLGRKFSMFTSFEGRTIKVSDEQMYEETGHRKYQSEKSASFNGGLKLKLGATELAGYAGKSLGNEIFGQGKSQFGASIAYIFGSKRTAAPSTRIEFADDEKKEDKTADVKSKSAAPKKPTDPNAILDPYGNEIDMANEYDRVSNDRNDDFNRATRRVRAQSKTQSGEEGYAFEAELEKIHDSEKKAQIEEEAKERAAEDQRRANARQQLKEDNKKEQELRRDVLKNEKLPEITDEEANWNILD